jgi:hypothetical protein
MPCRNPTEESAVPKFVLLLRESPQAFTGLSPEEIQAIIQRYIDWVARLQREGRFVSGEKLAPDGRAVRLAAGRVLTDRLFAESKEVVGGLIVLEADSYEHAVALTEGSPHFERGWIEIRQVERA